MAAYVYATWLADVLRAAKLSVVEVPGWQTRGRPHTTGGSDPRAIVVHHDASPMGYSPAEVNVIEDGRSDLPGPLAQLWLDDHGVWHVVAAGRCNHAGLGDGWGVIPKDSGNTYAIGIEIDHTVGEAWSPELYASLVTGIAALARYMKIDVRKAVCGHKEYAPGRKIDPAGIDLDKLRSDSMAQAVKLANAKVVNPDHGPWGPWPIEATHAFGPNPKHYATWHDGSDSKSDAAQVKAIQREVGLKPTGVYDKATTDKVAAYKATYKLGHGGGVDKATWQFMVRR